MSPTEIAFSNEQWNSLLDLTGFEGGEVGADHSDLLEDSTELTRVSRGIAGQYAGVLATFAARAFRGEAFGDASEQAMAALNSLHRLAVAAGDTAQIALLEELRDVIPGASEKRTNARIRHQSLALLRDWIPRFAETLTPADAQNLLDLVTWDPDSSPLMEELASLHGIGPRRLGRLFAAGLHSMEIVAGADPIEVAQVTGLPRSLAERVVEATATFAVRERRRCLEQLRDRARRLRQVLRSVQPNDDDIGKLVEEASREIELTFLQFDERGSS